MKVVVSVDIDRPLEPVFQFVGDFENDPKWWTGVASSQRTKDGVDRLGTGAEYLQHVQTAGVKFPQTFTVTQYDPPRMMQTQCDMSLIRYVATFLYEPLAADRTRVTMDADVEFTGAFKFLQPLLTPLLRSQSWRFFSGLKTAAEREIPKT